MLPRSMVNQARSNRRFFLLVNKSSKVTTLSNNIGEKNMEQNNGNKDHTVADLNKIVEEEGEDGEKLKEELSACQHFLVDTEMENGRHKVFNFQMSKLDTKIINEKLEEVFNKLDSAAKINIALGFVLRNLETGEYRYCYAHENNTLLEKSHVLCTKVDLITIQGKLEK